jgi:hypothetical protein
MVGGLPSRLTRQQAHARGGCHRSPGNLAGLLVLRPAQAKSLNMRGAYLEVLGDLIGSLAVVAAAVLILITGWTPFDAIASLLIVVGDHPVRLVAAA